MQQYRTHRSGSLHVHRDENGIRLWREHFTNIQQSDMCVYVSGFCSCAGPKAYIDQSGVVYTTFIIQCTRSWEWAVTDAAHGRPVAEATLSHVLPSPACRGTFLWRLCNSRKWIFTATAVDIPACDIAVVAPWWFLILFWKNWRRWSVVITYERCQQVRTGQVASCGLDTQIGRLIDTGTISITNYKKTKQTQECRHKRQWFHNLEENLIVLHSG